MALARLARRMAPGLVLRLRPSHDDSRPLPITGRGLWHVGGDINVRYVLVAAAGAVVGALALGAYVLWRMIPSWLSSD